LLTELHTDANSGGNSGNIIAKARFELAPVAYFSQAIRNANDYQVH